MKKIGYVRVSSQTQNSAEQMKQLQEIEVEKANIYREEITGERQDNRPELQRY